MYGISEAMQDYKGQITITVKGGVLKAPCDHDIYDFESGADVMDYVKSKQKKAA